MTNITFLSSSKLYDPKHGFGTDVLHHYSHVATPAYLRAEAQARLLIEVLFGYRDQGKYLLHEFVVMPDHIHLLLTPAAEISLERAVQFIKGGYSYRLRKVEKIQVWQKSFTNHRIRDAEDYERHREYVRENPVRARLVRDAVTYAFSSAGAGLRLDATPQGLKLDLSKSA